MPNDEMYCLLCHGRGLDSKDHPCGRCKGTGYEPETFVPGRGPAGCHALHFHTLHLPQAVPSRLYTSPER